jgi:hypothetical protein
VCPEELRVAAEKELLGGATMIQFDHDGGRVWLADALDLCAFNRMNLVRNGGEAESVKRDHVWEALVTS